MDRPPKWFVVLAVVALLWNLAGLAAVVSDLRVSPEALAAMPAAQRALHEARPGWSVLASVVAVAAGTLGCLGLLLRRRWALPLLVASLVGVVAQDVALFGLVGRAPTVNGVAVVLQGVVLATAVGLVLLARTAGARGWLRPAAP